jgi:hypothetical protein
MENREEILNQLGADRAALTQLQPVQRIQPNLAAEGYDLKRGFINKQDGEVYYAKPMPTEDRGIREPIIQFKNLDHYFECFAEDVPTYFEKM